MTAMMIEVPKGHGVCPCCKGTGRVPLEDHDEWMRTWPGGLPYYDEDTDTKTCQNCGGQMMWGTAVGYTKLPDGAPEGSAGCLHQFTPRNMGRCYTLYTCNHCKTEYGIDSGD